MKKTALFLVLLAGCTGEWTPTPNTYTGENDRPELPQHKIDVFTGICAPSTSDTLSCDW